MAEYDSALPVKTKDGDSVAVGAVSCGAFYPVNTKTETELVNGEKAPLKLDSAGNLMTRSAVLTDENSVYEPFAGTSLSSAWTSSVGTGCNLVVANSTLTLSSGTTDNQSVYINQEVDFAPLVLTGVFSISQRINNQDIYFGFSNSVLPGASQMCRFHFYGTDATKVSLESRSSSDPGGDEGTNTQVLIPLGLNTSSFLTYRIIFNGKKVDYFIGSDAEHLVLVSTHSANFPDPYTVLNARCRIGNGVGVVSNTDVVFHTIVIKNYNIVDIEGTVDGKVAITQDIQASGSNNTSDNLAVGATFTGVGEATTKVAAIQITFKADQLCLVQCQQSVDNVNWDISDSWQVQASTGDARTVQATGSFFRLLVTNQGTAPTTYLRLQAILCPLVEAVPRALTQSGGLLTTPIDSNQGAWRGKVTSDGDLRTTTLGAPLINIRFTGSYFDSYNLFEYQAGGGTRTNNDGVCFLATASGASTSAIWTKKITNLAPSKLSIALFALAFDNVTQINNRRVWGLSNPGFADGVFFELKDGVLSACRAYAGVTTRTNIDYFKPANGTMNRWEIQTTAFKAHFMLNGNLLASINLFGSSDVPMASNLFLPLMVYNTNTGAASSCNLDTQYIAFYNASLVGNVIIDPEDSTNVSKISKTGRLQVAPQSAMRFNESFPDDTFDTVKIWEENIVGGASHSVFNDALKLSVTNGAADSIEVHTRKEYYPTSSGESQMTNMLLNFGQTLDNNNTREWGTKSGNNGAFFRIQGMSGYCVVVKNGVESTIDIPGLFTAISDDKFYKFSIRRFGQLYIWFYFEGAEVGFFSSGSNTTIVGETEDCPYLANYNTGVTTTPCLINCLSITVEDSGIQSNLISGTPDNGTIQPIKTDEDGRIIPAPFEAIQTAINYTGSKVTSTVDTDKYGNVLTTTFNYTGTKVTSISQVLS